MITRTVVGVCTNPNDPDQAGKIRVACETLLATGEEISEWIEPGDLHSGEFFLPERDDPVYIEFDYYDPEHDAAPWETFLANPNYRWHAYPYTVRSGNHPLSAVFRAGYPNRRGYVSPRGHFSIFDDPRKGNQQRVAQGHARGNQVIYHPDGSITIHATDGSTVQLSTANKAIILTQAKGSTVILGESGAGVLSPGGAYVSVQDAAVDVVCAGTVTVSAPAVSLAGSSVLLGLGAGGGAGAGAARGDELLAYLLSLYAWLAALTLTPGGYTAPPGGGPVTGVSGTPVTPPPSPPESMVSDSVRVK